MSKQNVYLIRILNSELKFELYFIDNDRLSLISTSNDWTIIQQYSSNIMVISLSLDLIAVGNRQVKQKKISNSIFYFEKNIINSKSEIYFLPAIIRKNILTQIWVKKNLWVNLIQKINNLKLLVKTITIDSCIIEVSGTLPRQIFNTYSKFTHLIETPFDFSRLANSNQAIQNFDNLKIHTSNIYRSQINFQNQNLSRNKFTSFLLISLMIFNLFLVSIPYWGSFNPLQQLFQKNNLELQVQLDRIETLSKKEQFPLIIKLEDILSQIIDSYNQRISNIYLEENDLTLILENLNDNEVNEISNILEKKEITIKKILTQNNQVIIEASFK